ncbi:uncharacterized protein METZ01_LOCUS362901, partial [marine metagenome]
MSTYLTICIFVVDSMYFCATSSVVCE